MGDSGSQSTDDRTIQSTCSPSYIQKGRSSLDEKPNQQSEREETTTSLIFSLLGSNNAHI